MIRSTFTAALVAVLLCAAGWAASPPKIVGDEGATIEDLIREQKYVTIVLNNGARDQNYRIRLIAEESLGVTDGTGLDVAFNLDDIRELRVQKGIIQKDTAPRKESALTTDDRKIVETAANRAFDLFNTSRGDQYIRMQAAMALATSDHESSESALAYLKELMAGNDTPTALRAAGMVWRAGGEPSDSVVVNGLNSGNRNTKAEAATLAGLLGDPKYLLDIRRLLKDPTPEVFPSAAMAVGRIDDRESLPALYEGIRALNEQKGEACAVALQTMGGSDIKQHLLTMLPEARGNEWFRIVRALHAMGDDQATALLRERAIRQPAYDRITAAILIRQNAPEAIEFMREFLKKPLDPDEANLVYKGQVGLLLYLAGDIQAKGVIQDVLTISPNLIYARGRESDDQFKQRTVSAIQSRVCAMIGNTGNREFISLLAASIQSPDPAVAIRACIAALQIANPQFGERVRDMPL